MFPIPSFLLSCLAAFVFWWIVTRLGLVSAWIFSKPGSLGLRHYVFLFLAAMPLGMEAISTIMMIFALAFGLDPREKK